MDVLSDVLRTLRLSGAVLFRADFCAPWDVSSPGSGGLAEMLMPGAGRLVLFHVITGGECWAEVEGEPRVSLREGDVVVFPYGDAHVMGWSDGAHRVSITDLLPMPPWSEPPFVRCGGDGVPTHVVCGFLHCDDALFNPLLATLPRVFAVNAADGDRAQWLDLMVDQGLKEAGQGRPGGDALLTRFAELMLLDVLRRHMAQAPSSQTGLLAALNDEQVAQALELIHASPADPWTVDLLGKRIGMSRSSLAARFKQLLGMPPMQYISRLRLQKATQLLRDTDRGIAEIANEVGYDSEPAFNRAFKRAVGQPPAAWRKAQ
ncbi:MAG: AraC family transcriptional regulator [Polyangiales bacterium]